MLILHSFYTAEDDICYGKIGLCERLEISGWYKLYFLSIKEENLIAGDFIEPSMDGHRNLHRNLLLRLLKMEIWIVIN